MTQQVINVGGNTPNNGEGETLRSGAVKINENFSELYAAVGIGGSQTFVNSVAAGTGISVSASSGHLTITNSSPNIPAFTAITVAGQSSVLATNNSALTITGGTNVTVTTNASANSVTITSTQQEADWNASSGPTAILNKPSIPAAQIQSDWNQANVSTVDYIKNKPAIPTDFSQLTDNTNMLHGNDYVIISQTTASIDPSSSAVIYSSTGNNVATGIKATIIVGGVRGSTEQQSMICEFIVTRTFPVSGNPTVTYTQYGKSNTYGGGDLATFTAQYSSGGKLLTITATNTSSTSGETIAAKVIATEFR